jgi:hypothetical protein
MVAGPGEVGHCCLRGSTSAAKAAILQPIHGTTEVVPLPVSNPSHRESRNLPTSKYALADLAEGFGRLRLCRTPELAVAT